jgi:hypothetical protein
VLLDRLVRKLRSGEETHALEREVPQVRFPVGEKRAELVARPHEESWFTVRVDDERYGFEQNRVLCVRVLNLLRLRGLLGFVQDRLEAFVQAASDTSVICNTSGTMKTLLLSFNK